jgi:carboxylesterase type B
MRLLPTALPILAATWLYDFTWRSPRLGACHTLDVPFTFGDADTGDPGWP